MHQLGKHLAASVLPGNCQPEIHRLRWNEFLDKVQVEDLESALTSVDVTPELLDHIVQVTWECINTADFLTYNQVIADQSSLPLCRLFRHLFRSTNPEIHVITPNYDRIAEYAAEAAGYSSYTGFTLGLFGQRTDELQRIYVNRRPIRTVNIWKVHGSLGWFQKADGTIVSLPPLGNRPNGFTPVIVTPGTEKYRRTHQDPFRTAMRNADQAVANAKAFLCIGYGFNDEHLQHRLNERCKLPDIPLVLLTKGISQSAHRFLRSGQCSRYVALEESPNGVRMFSHQTPDGIELIGQPSWRLDHFLTLINA